MHLELARGFAATLNAVAALLARPLKARWRPPWPPWAGAAIRRTSRAPFTRRGAPRRELRQGSRPKGRNDIAGSR